MKKLILVFSFIAASVIQDAFAHPDSSLIYVVNAYFNLKNALIKDNGAVTQEAARQLFEAMNKVTAERLPEEQGKIWMSYRDKLAYDVEPMKSTDDLDRQHDHFGNLSVNIFRMLKKLKINTADIYLQFCPMANEGKGGYWLSEKSTISNPYMAKQMPHCGSTKETLEGVK